MSGLAGAGEVPLPDLIDRLAHLDRLERVGAAAELVRRGRSGREMETAVVELLVAALRDQRVILRKMAALVLGDLAAESERAVPALVEALANPDEGLRRRAVVALGQFRTAATAAIPALRSALHDQDEGVRSFAATSLALIDPTGHPEEAA
jgi:HEAT repeat protein